MRGVISDLKNLFEFFLCLNEFLEKMQHFDFDDIVIGVANLVLMTVIHVAESCFDHN